MGFLYPSKRISIIRKILSHNLSYLDNGNSYTGKTASLVGGVNIFNLPALFCAKLHLDPLTTISFFFQVNSWKERGTNINVDEK